MFYPALTPAEFQKSLHPIVRVDAVAKIFRNKVLPADLSGKQVLHYSIPNVQEIGTGKIEDGDTIDSDKWLITEEAVLISKLNPRKSTICLASPQDGITVASTEFVVLSTGNSIDNRYIKYILESEIVRQFLTSRSTSATRSHQRVNPHDIIALGIPWPEESTRTKIVKELNRELAEIDAFIAEQERLLELTTEKFNAELRLLTSPIGVATVPLKRFAEITLGKMITPSDKGGMELAPYIRAANIQPGGVFTYATDQKKMWFSSEELSYLDLKKDDVLVVEGGAGFGRSAVLTENLPGWGFQNSINRVRVNRNLADPHFIHYCLQAQLLFGDLDNLTNQSTIPHLTAEKLALVQIPAIDSATQAEISEKLNRREDSLTKTENEINISINLLDEKKKQFH